MTVETKNEIISWVKVILAAVIFSLVITQFVIVHANVPTASMIDTVPVKSRIVGNRLAYLFSEPERFDVVAFKFPDNEKEIYLKRIIGLPGETIEIIDGKVYIDGSDTSLDDSFVKEPPRGSFGPYTVPEGHYFMLGDNRNSSKDSREWVNKFVAKNKLLGKVIFTYFPEVKLIK